MKYGLIGKKLSHSYSCEVHRKNGFEYVLREILPEAVGEFVRNCPLDGFNVTIPYKKTVIPYLDELSEEAKSVGAVNTVRIENGKRYGYNTDVYGMERMIAQKNISLRGKKVLILGSGGTGTTARFLTEREGGTPYTVSRNGELNYENCYEKCAEAEVVINATPVGMYPHSDESPLDLSRFHRLTAVFDCIYHPFRTRLLLQAERMGIACSNGLPMLVEQALMAERIWENRPLRGAKEIVADLYREKCNLVLYGMPSCGKSHVGRLVAERMGREFIDIDRKIEEKTGISCERLILQRGEEAFRGAEKEVVAEISDRSGAVIACGGGTVTVGENVDALRKNGILIYLKRDTTLLKTDGRPISRRTGIARLYEIRKDVYEGIADGVCENNAEIKRCVDKAVEIYENTCYQRT